MHFNNALRLFRARQQNGWSTRIGGRINPGVEPEGLRFFSIAAPIKGRKKTLVFFRPRDKGRRHKCDQGGCAQSIAITLDHAGRWQSELQPREMPRRAGEMNLPKRAGGLVRGIICELIFKARGRTMGLAGITVQTREAFAARRPAQPHQSKQQKAQARAAGKFKMDKALDYTGAGNDFVGYEDLTANAKVLALFVDGDAVNELQAGQAGVVVLDTTTFYAESGGQVGDQGMIHNAGGQFSVADTLKIKADVFGHHGELSTGSLKVGDAVQAHVDTAVRAATVRNHSATHLMHKALREVLGSHVQQKGSLVNAERTRFDFAHNAPVTDAQILKIEALVNAEILANAAAAARVMDIESAQKTGAMMLFGEKYGETVRVLDIGSSRELCGGTHVQRTGDIGLFKVVAEGGVAAGVRRIEAVTGVNALTYLQSLESTVAQAASSFKAPTAELNHRIAQVLDQVKALEKEMSALKGKLASFQGDELMTQALDIKGVKLLVAKLDGADAKTLRDTMDKLKDKMKSAVIVLAAADGEKVNIAAGITADHTGKVKAGELANFVAQQVGGKGGGKPDMAMAGGTNAAALPAALASVQAWVAERV